MAGGGKGHVTVRNEYQAVINVLKLEINCNQQQRITLN